jgi:hypothetical protein
MFVRIAKLLGIHGTRKKQADLLGPSSSRTLDAPELLAIFAKKKRTECL